ncbi:MAG: multidrug efflux RND transporter permease subunit [Terrimicrobiaceae bacterium]
MNISHFFIDRPIFASVLSIIITIVGGVALMTLPIAQYPEIVPPTVAVSASYSGANAATVAETVAAPIEQQVNGVENMLYMSSQSASDGSYALTVTFKLGTNLDTAQVLVQNRVNLALPVLPEEVRRTGVSVNKQSASMIMCVNLISPDGSSDELYLNNYALLQIKDTLARINGVGSVTIFGSEYSMRIWLDPNKLAALDLTASDVVQAIQEQNKQVAAGVVGQEPAPQGTQFQVVVNTQGRLVEPAEFSRIVIKRGEKGEVIRLSEVGTVDLGAKNYAVTSNLDGKPAATLAIYQLPGSNALSTAKAVRKTMDTLKQSFPTGVDYKIVYDTTVFVNESVRAVEHTLLEAIALVGIVVMLFLQTWRATIIPLIAVPVSLIGTFAAMAAFGFSLNTISLFGLVLAIGIVVDDAIVVVEAMEHKLSLGMSPRDAARQAMDEVGGAVIAVALVLSAVFIPTAFITGITGQFFRQFALTIAVSTIISAFNSLTMSPALGVLLLRPHGEQNDILSRFFNKTLGWFFRAFNKTFDWLIARYGRSVASIVRKLAICGLLYVGLLALTGYGFKVTPVGFVPQQDQGYLIAACQLPDAASLERTQAVTAKALALIRETPGVETSLVINGFSMLSGSNQSNVGSIIVILDGFEERKGASLSADAILQNLRAKFNQIPEALVFAFGPPPIQGVGTTGGFGMMVQDRRGGEYQQLQAITQNLIEAGNQQPGLVGLFSSFRADTPEVFVDVDRSKAKSMNVPLSNVFDALQIYLGSAYVNDFTFLGRSFQVNAQADSKFRVTSSDILKLKTRSIDGKMVPLSTLASIQETFGPGVVTRYNLYTAADLSGDTKPGYSSGHAISVMEELCRRLLPPGFGFEWTGLTYQQILAGNTTLLIFPLCVLFVFLTLAAQYESWALPFAIILIVPMCILSALAGVLLRRMDNNIFTQIGFVVLVGLACKNAILIVEYAKQSEDSGKDTISAVVEACKLRLRPILMTSFAFIAGVVPLMLGSGAGAEMRQTLGTAVFAGMLGVTIFGIFLTPVFYVIIRKFSANKRKVAAKAA